MEPHIYDGIIVITAPDLERVKCNLAKLKEYMPVRKLVFVGSAKVGQLVESIDGIDASFIDENDLIPFEAVEEAICKKLGVDTVPRGIVGWYYQQFLKLKYASICKDKYYLVWDGDTIPCNKFSMFGAEQGKPFFDMKTEYNENYFLTMSKLIPGAYKIINKSFISEHMIFDCNIMGSLIEEIEKNDKLSGNAFYEKIINSIDVDKFRLGCFSEFETYGTYVALRCPEAYMLRDWHSLRFGSFFFKPEEMKDEDFAWLSKDFHAISFEKGDEYLEEYAALFRNPEYRAKLTPRHIVEALQEENVLVANVVEKW